MRTTWILTPEKSFGGYLNSIGHCCFNFCNTAKWFGLGTFANLGLWLKIKLGPHREILQGERRNQEVFQELLRWAWQIGSLTNPKDAKAKVRGEAAAAAAVAAAKSRQSCPTLCDPIDGSPAGSSVPGILQWPVKGRLKFPSLICV